MLKRIIVATNNEHKIFEIKNILSPYGVEVLSLKDANIVSNPEENGTTFHENAFIKANAVKQFTNEVVLSDDSGLCVHALNGFPGTHSSRFMEDHPYKDKWKYINDTLKDYEDKSAHFECDLCILNLEDKPLYFEGKVDGTIVQPKGESGFGYDPIFYVEEKKKTFGEMSSDEKNSLSHRARALEKFLNYLIKNQYVIK